MKLIRYGAEGQEKPGVIIDEKYYDVSHLVNDYDEKFFSGNAIEELKEKIAAGGLTSANRITGFSFAFWFSTPIRGRLKIRISFSGYFQKTYPVG